MKVRAMRRSLTAIGIGFTVLFAPLSATAADEYPRDARVDVLAYEFAIEVSDGSDELLGDASIRVAFTAPGVEKVTLDLIGSHGDTGMVVDAVSANGAPAQYEHDNDRLSILLPHAMSTGDTVRLRVQYHGVAADGLIIGTTKYGDRSFFGDNYPDRARNWLPTVDHVSDKATVDFVITAPSVYQVVANGALVEETDRGDGRRTTRWSCSVPLSPKVMVFGAANFAVQHLEPVGGVPVQSWVYPQDREAGFSDFRQAREILAFFADHIGPYPYAKLANVQSKTRYGGMENAGSIFYSENSIRGDGGNESLVAHEIAHQWFGDSITEADWHHVWLSEGFATYFAALYLESAHGHERLVERMEPARRRVLQYHGSHPDTPVVDMRRLDMTRLLTANAYQKGGWILHMLRREIGDEFFWNGIREYYRRFRDLNASTADFEAVMTEAAGEDLSGFFEQWLMRPGQPTLQGTWNYSEDDAVVAVDVRQTQAGDTVFRAPLDIGIEHADGSSTVTTMRLTGRQQVLRIELSAAPTAVIFDPDTWLLFRDAGLTGRPYGASKERPLAVRRVVESLEVEQ